MTHTIYVKIQVFAVRTTRIDVFYHPLTDQIGIFWGNDWMFGPLMETVIGGGMELADLREWVKIGEF